MTRKNNQFIEIGGQHHTLVLTHDKKCWAIGRKDYGRLGIGPVKEEAVDTLTPIDLSDITEVACGECCSFAITTNGMYFILESSIHSPMHGDLLNFPYLATGRCLVRLQHSMPHYGVILLKSITIDDSQFYNNNHFFIINIRI